MANYFDQFEEIKDNNIQTNQKGQSYWEQFEEIKDENTQNNDLFGENTQPNNDLWGAGTQPNFTEQHPVLDKAKTYVTDTVLPKVEQVSKDVIHNVGSGLVGGLTMTGKSLQSVKPYQNIEQSQHIVSDPIMHGASVSPMLSVSLGKNRQGNDDFVIPENPNDLLSQRGTVQFNLSATKNVLTDSAIQQLSGSDKKEFATRAITEVVKNKFIPQEQNSYNEGLENSIEQDVFDSQALAEQNYYLNNGLEQLQEQKKTYDLFPHTLIPVTDAFSGVGQVLSNVLPYLMSGNYNHDLKGLVRDVKEQFKYGFGLADEMRKKQDFNEYKFVDMTMDIASILTLIEATGGKALEPLIKDYGLGFIYTGLNSLKDKGVTNELLKDAAMGGAEFAVLGYGLRGLGKLADKWLPAVIQRMKPSNYEQVLKSKPVERGMGLSRRTVYEPRVSYEYKPTQNLGKDINPIENIGNNTRGSIGNKVNEVQVWKPNFELGDSAILNNSAVINQGASNMPLLIDKTQLPTIEHYNNPQSDFVMPNISEDVLNNLQKNQKPLVLKKNIIEKNKRNHPELSTNEYNNVLEQAIYNPNYVIQTKPKTKPNYYSFISKNTADNKISVIELSDNKDNYEIVNFFKVDEKRFNEYLKRAEHEGGEVLITKKNDFQGSARLSDLESDSNNIITDNSKDFKGSAETLANSENIGNNKTKGVANEQERTTRTSSTLGRKNASSEINGRSDDVSGRRNNFGLESERGRGELRGRIAEEHQSIINAQYKNQHELNKAIENFVANKEYEKYSELPEEVKNWLKKFTGAGGLEKQGAEGKGLLSEYYTPENIVKKMWDLTSQYIDTANANALESSVGIGRFLEFAPENVNFDAVEMNPISAKITELLYPKANVRVGEFQEQFIDKTRNLPVKSVTPKYDIVIGNPPYGQYSGRYKGLGEGKKHGRLESYFISRGLDTLKENGIMTYIVPSSFLDSVLTPSKQEISTKCELLDAYRLPEKTFDTTSIGTDIIVLRKTNGKGSDSNLRFGNWFKQHPEKILGSVEQRKNKFGKQETFVKGDKNAVDTIDTSKKNIKQTIATELTPVIKNAKPKVSLKAKKSTENIVKGNVEYTEYQAENPVSDEDYQYFADTRVDGTLPKEKYSPNEKVNQYNGELYNDFNYLQGDIYEKLDALDNENISKKQKEIQKKKLLSVLPKAKKLDEIRLTPTSDFVREFPMTITDTDYMGREVEETTSLDKKYLKYVRSLTKAERNGINVWDIEKFVTGDKIVVRSSGSKEEKDNKRAEYLTKLKQTVDKTFNDFINSELSQEDKARFIDSWNRTFNGLYTPNYTKMPMIVKNLNSEFYGKKLKLQNVQIEGINYLTNKGVGLLGFEVGVGKTLSGIIATVQNMQMGRCKRPLILVPKQVKPNWIKEINESFPNMKVNDLDNLSKFQGSVEDGTISIATFQALDNLWYSEKTLRNLLDETYSIKNDFSRESTNRGMEKSRERIEQFFGAAEKGNKKSFNIEDLGIDHITVDEAHNFKNLFGDAKADGQQGNPYVKIAGAESTRAKRLFLATQYILNNNNNRNIFMLTATPFNNSPLEVFNMLSYLAKDKLDKMGLYNVYQFMENYVDISADWVVDSKNDVVFKQIASGFKNLQSLQSVVKSCMLIRSAEDAGIKRPNKHTKRVTLEPTQEQLNIIAEAESEAIHAKKDDKGAVLKAISKARIATISPDIYNKNIEVSPEDFIKNSPKLEYVMNAVESMKNSDPNTSQLIYMPIGVDFLPKIKQYLVNKGVYKANEIAIIKAGVNDDKISEIVDSFNDEKGALKLIIGTNKMKEGMNLNKNSSVLYVPYMDWNPTDYMQIVGRIWRRGNKYNDVRVVVPLLKDSSDPFMFQKLDEKTNRINNIMDTGKDYIDTSELSTADEKINMITN
ncbi:MAG: SNF2-related protein, partial [Muribaculaceae bacterium]|nr:SNF2-related protein [Muribaculaceae bacterium]